MTDIELIDQISRAITKLRYKDVYIDKLSMSLNTYNYLTEILTPEDNSYRDTLKKPLIPMINGVELHYDKYVAENRIFASENGEIMAVFKF